MDITIVGSGTAVPRAGHSPACVALLDGDALLLLDVGPGSLSRLADLGLSPARMRVVGLTHHHADHVLDVLMLLQAFRHTPGWTRTEELVIVGGAGTRRFLSRMCDLFPDVRPVDYTMTVLEVASTSLVIDGWHVRTVPTGHTREAIAFRVARGSTPAVVYTGDAADVAAIARVADGADTLISECSFPDGWATLSHLTASDAGRAAASANVRRLILTHRYPPAIEADVANQARRHFSGTVVAASDGLRLTV